MTRLKYISSNITLCNLLLAAVILFMANATVLPLLSMQVQYTLPLKKIPATQDEGKPEEFSAPSLSDYVIVSEENLFHPERKIPAEKTEETQLPKPDIVLYGTVVSDNIRIAYLEDLKAPRTTPGRGRRQIALRRGDSLSGFKLTEIQTDYIVMVKGEEKITVHVLDPQKPKTREHIAATTPPSSSPAGQPIQPVRAPVPRKPAVTRQELPASLGGKPSPLPKTRAPMTPADEKVQDFFKKQ